MAQKEAPTCWLLTPVQWGGGVSVSFLRTMFVSAKTFDIDVFVPNNWKKYDGLELSWLKNGGACIRRARSQQAKSIQELLKKEIKTKTSWIAQAHECIQVGYGAVEALFGRSKSIAIRFAKQLMPFLLFTFRPGVATKSKTRTNGTRGAVWRPWFRVESTIVRSIFKEIQSDKEIRKEKFFLCKTLKGYHNSNAFQPEVHLKEKPSD